MLHYAQTALIVLVELGLLGREITSHILPSFGHRSDHFVLVTTMLKTDENVPSKGEGKPEPVLAKFFSGKTGMGNEGKEMRMNRTITRLLEGILFICGPRSIICARAERGCK